MKSINFLLSLRYITPETTVKNAVENIFKVKVEKVKTNTKNALIKKGLIKLG